MCSHHAKCAAVNAMMYTYMCVCVCVWIFCVQMSVCGLKFIVLTSLGCSLGPVCDVALAKFLIQYSNYCPNCTALL